MPIPYVQKDIQYPVPLSHLIFGTHHSYSPANARLKIRLSQSILLENHNRLKIMFVCRNKSGSLASVLSMISDYGVNLTEIHSVPFRRDEWNYRFYIEMDGNLLTKETQALVFQLMNETEEFKILGSYFCEE